ncbi:MAG: ABC transporter ATP-binding protein/permease [Spirochaetes bacterium]|nr:ABC transporter ATP-binding protein/permease [Spirochaetota bacterium]
MAELKGRDGFGRTSHPIGMTFRPGRSPGGPVYLGPKEKPKNTKRTILRMFQFLSGGWVTLFFVFMLVFISSLSNLFGPYLIGKVVDTFVGGAGRVDFRAFTHLLTLLLALYSVGGVCTFFQYYLMASLSQDVVFKIRETLFHHLQVLPVSFFDRQSQGDLMSRMTNDIENINMTLSQGILQVFSSFITLMGAFLMMLFLSPTLTWIALFVIPFGFLLTSLIAHNTRRAFSLQQSAVGNLNGLIEETITGIWIVKAFTGERKVMGRFSAINRELRKQGIWAQILAGTVPPLMNLMNNLSFLFTAVGGGWMVLQKALSVGTVASFLQYSRQFMRPINEFANQINLLQAALAGAERVFEILDVTPEELEPLEENTRASLSNQELKKVGSKEMFPMQVNRLSFTKVCFSYFPEVPVLREITFDAWRGKTIAIVGPTGAGKTTLVSLLTRFYDPDVGMILFDEQNTRTLPKTLVRRSLGIVLQDTYLFSATVRENIRYGRLDATDEEVEEIARLVEADSFIRKLPQGYDTVLTDEGLNISQGERQLITLARALLANPPILILDEATSNVDSRTELHIQRALRQIRKGRISIMIAHRLSTIRDADMILVLQDGRIIERGNHRTLLEAGGVYHTLYHAQFQRQAELRFFHNLVE